MRRYAVRSAIGAALLLVAGPAAAGAVTGNQDSSLSSRLQELSSKDLRGASPSEQADAVSLVPRGAGSLLRGGGAPVVEITVAGDPGRVAASLTDAGAQVVGVSRALDTVTAAVPERELRAVGHLAGVEWVQEVITPMAGRVGDDTAGGAINTCETGVVSEGDEQMNAQAARTAFDVDGTGVDVGVLSDSYDRRDDLATKAPDDIATGDLPGPGNPCGRTDPVDVLDDSAPDPPTSATVGDEGRAMLQIVHDLAPGAGLKFATAFTGQAEFADNIRALADDGADVIVDDIIYFTEPMYQDGVVANAVSEVTDEGVAYFTMAFNNNGLGINSYEAPAYRSTTCPAIVLAADPGPDDCMDFDPGPGADNQFDIGVSSGASRLSFNWAEAEDAVGTDFDFYVLNTSGTAISFAGTSDSLASQQAIEFVSGTFGSAGARQIVIRRFAGSGTPRMKWVSNDNGANRITSTQPVASPDVQGPTVYGHNGTASAQTVGAVPFNDANAIEPFSSRGPVTHLFGPVQDVGAAPALAAPRVLSKPEVAATDRGINTFFGPGNRFAGTSAAAPHAAAVGALALEANPAVPLGQLKADQEATAVPVGAFGPFAAGSGLIQADGALAAATTPFPVVTVNSGNGPTADATPEVTFSASAPGVAFACAVDAGAPVPCSSPFSPSTPLSDGPHQIQITATDVFEHTGSATASPSVDTTGPAAKITKGPKRKTRKAKAAFAFSAEPGATFECKLDRRGFAACTSPRKVKVKKGKHSFQVRAADTLGNVGAVASRSWTVKKKKKR